MPSQMHIWMKGSDGSRWDLSGPGQGDQGAELRPGPKKLIDAPAKTFWVQGGARMHYQGHQFERRDPVFVVNIFDPTGRGNPDTWRDIDSRFRLALGMYDEEFQIVVEIGSDVRTLNMRLLSEPVAYENGGHEGKDPHLYAESTLLINAAASQPFWSGPDIVQEWELPSGTSGSTSFVYQNRGDVIIWPRYFVTAPGTWTLPDRSWGQEIAHQRPVGADLGRDVPLPALLAGEDADVNSDPDEEYIVTANNSPAWARANGKSLLYPIKARTKPVSLPISVTGATAGAAIQLTLPQRFSRPLGVSL
ncbi:hypothetical protein [Nocardia thailandica]|uniref:hypothetical protein n=1 Tax=Nocardia thailandica TaxID=257275 RepID=UPI0005B87D84|nr:hypothetical protein [Nocardia thailandica]